jgi:hypothetical protein
MPDTALETALAALASALDAATTVEVIRNSDRPEAIPAGGIVVVGDGEQTEVEETFFPLRYHIQHTAEVIVLAPTEAARDTLLGVLSAALVADRTLAGAVEWSQVEPVSFDLGDYEGAEAVRAARMPVALFYTTLGSPAA